MQQHEKHHTIRQEKQEDGRGGGRTRLSFPRYLTKVQHTLFRTHNHFPRLRARQTNRTPIFGLTFVSRKTKQVGCCAFYFTITYLPAASSERLDYTNHHHGRQQQLTYLPHAPCSRRSKVPRGKTCFHHKFPNNKTTHTNKRSMPVTDAQRQTRYHLLLSVRRDCCSQTAHGKTG